MKHLFLRSLLILLIIGQNQYILPASDAITNCINNITNNIENNIEGALKEAGINITDLVSTGQDVAQNAQKFNGVVGDFTRTINGGPVPIVKNVIGKAETFKTKVQNAINQAKIDINDLKSNLNDPATLIAKVQGVGGQVSGIVDELKTSISDFTNTADKLDLKPTLKALTNLLDLVKNLVNNLKSIISDLPDKLLNHKAIDPLKNIAGDLQNIIGKLTALEAASLTRIEDLPKKLLTGILMNFADANEIVQKVRTDVEAIVPNVNQLNNGVSKVSQSASVVGSTVSGAKDTLVNEIKQPNNIQAAVSALGGGLYTIVSSGCKFTPDTFKPLAGLVTDLTKPILQDAKLQDLTAAINQSAGSLANVVSQASGIVDYLKNKGLDVIPPDTASKLADLVPDVKSLAAHVSDLNGVKLVQ